MHALIAVQVAFCFLVHFTAGLFVSTFDRLSNQPTRLFRGADSQSGNGDAARAAAGLLGSGGRTPAHGAGRGDGGADRMAAAERRERGRKYFDQRRASDRRVLGLPERLAGLDGRHANSVDRRQRLSRGGHESHGARSSTRPSRSNTSTGRIRSGKSFDEWSRRAGALASRSWALSATPAPETECACPSGRRPTFRFHRSTPRACCNRRRGDVRGAHVEREPAGAGLHAAPGSAARAAANSASATSAHRRS